jgi:RND family efflux transporter MFP subunit
MNVRVLVTVAGLAAGCHVAGGSQKSLTVVKVRAVDSASDSSSARYSANFEPATRVDLAFKVGGYVDQIAHVRGVDGKARVLQEGDLVTRGTELASVRKSDYTQKLGEAKAALAEALAARDQAQLDADRAEHLATTNANSKADLDAAKIKLQTAIARHDGAKVRVDEAQTMLADTTLKAPMDGVILKRGIEVGTLAAAGTLGFSIADTATVKVVFGVPDTVLDQLQLGASQLVTTEAFRGVEWQGRITRIAPAADAKSRVFEVEVSIPNAKQELKSGMVGALKLSQGARLAPVAVVPLAAVVRSRAHPERFAVYALDETETPPVARVREVELGDFLGNGIPVKAGLAAGQKIVVQGAALLSDGEPVRVLP